VNKMSERVLWEKKRERTSLSERLLLQRTFLPQPQVLSGRMSSEQISSWRNHQTILYQEPLVQIQAQARKSFTYRESFVHVRALGQVKISKLGLVNILLETRVETSTTKTRLAQQETETLISDHQCSTQEAILSETVIDLMNSR